MRESMNLQAILLSSGLFFISHLLTTPARADPTDPPTSALEILPAVELVFPTEPDCRYQLHRSTNLINWEPIEAAHEGTGAPIRRFQSATPGVRMFYRVESSRIIPLPPLLAGRGGIILVGPADAQRLTTFPDGSYILRDHYHSPPRFEERGVITATNRIGDSLSFVLTSTQTNAAFNGTVHLNFTTPGAGTLTLTRTNGSSPAGTFRYFDNQLPFTEGTRFYATNLSGLNLQLTYFGGGSEKFHFTSDSTLLYEDGQLAGTYTYSLTSESEAGTTGRLAIRLENDWLYEITINSTAAEVLFRSPFEFPSDPVFADYFFY